MLPFRRPRFLPGLVTLFVLGAGLSSLASSAEEAAPEEADEAAEEGLPAAKRLQAAGYDLDEITPDADNWKYAPLF